MEKTPYEAGDVVHMKIRIPAAAKKGKSHAQAWTSDGNAKAAGISS